MAVPQNPFSAAAAAAVASALDLDASLFAVSAPPKPELGDLAVGCFPAAKIRQAAPPKLAAEVAAGFQPTELLESATAAGPFVNFRVRRDALFRHLMTGESVDASAGAGKTVCIDFSSPNISKHLAYHHIRSTVIGHALCNLYRAVGYRVIGINHLGDWGTTHGMLLAAYHRWPVDEVTVDRLNDLYVRFRAAMKEDPSLEVEGRAWFKKLEDGDPEARRLWKHFRDVSLAEFQTVYDQLGIVFDEVKGESDYEDAMQPVLDLLDAKGLSTVSEGALVVPLEEADLPPLLLRKQDGATLYATRDLAAAIYRWETYHFERSLYVVDRGQGAHFKQLFLTLAKAGFEWADRLAHVPFGLVRIGGRKTGTRAGNVVLLREVIAEASERSSERIAAANPEMDPAVLADTARMVGVGAVVFANLVSQREKDVDFELEDILSTEGDSGPYIQYAHARCASILRKASGLEPDPGSAPALLGAAAEWSLALKLLDFGETVQRAADGNDPHLVSRYLLDLTSHFNRWYTSGNQDAALRVLCEDAAMCRARLALVATTQAVIARGLALLGLGAPEMM